ncbi:hypothetical protein [Endothiovibrio diazotrophicus]
MNDSPPVPPFGGHSFVGGASALLSAGCQADSGEPLRVGANTWLGYEPLYLAREEGLLDPRRRGWWRWSPRRM